MTNKSIFAARFGSHLYGTDTPTSDIDNKYVFIPDAKSILLQRVKGTISNKRPKAEGEKNFAGEIDEEHYALHNYLRLLAEGQTVALDMLFTPTSHIMRFGGGFTAEWEEIVANRGRLISRRSAAFVGYCRQQANKYGIKGSRVSAARKALDTLLMFEERLPKGRLWDYWPAIESTVRANPDHMRITTIEQVSGQILLYWEVCGRALGETTPIKQARECVQKIVEEYGYRALQAERNEGIDWKALSHAVRVGREALELFESGHITFPRPEATHLLDIKRGEIKYAKVAEEIETLLQAVELAAERSQLPNEPDHDWIDTFVANVYADQVRRAPIFFREFH